MKKRILVLLMFAAMSLNAMALDLWVKGGASQGSGSGKFNDTGYVGNLELSQGVLGFIDLGAGVGFNGNMKFDDHKEYTDISYDTVPVYGFVKFNIIPVGVKPYVVARFGGVAVVNDKTNYGYQGIMDGKEAEGGLYGAAGLGVEFLDSLQAEALYSVMEIKNNPTGEDYVEMFSLTLGYNFF